MKEFKLKSIGTNVIVNIGTEVKTKSITDKEDRDSFKNSINAIIASKKKDETKEKEILAIFTKANKTSTTLVQKVEAVVEKVKVAKKVEKLIKEEPKLAKEKIAKVQESEQIVMLSLSDLRQMMTEEISKIMKHDNIKPVVIPVQTPTRRRGEH